MMIIIKITKMIFANSCAFVGTYASVLIAGHLSYVYKPGLNEF